MSYYENAQWASPNQNNWEHQGATTPVRAGLGESISNANPAGLSADKGASAPQPQDEYAFSYQFDEVDRAYENLQKSGKGFVMGGRRKFSPMHGPGSARSTPDFGKYGRMPHGGPRSHSINSFDDSRGPSGSNFNNNNNNNHNNNNSGNNNFYAPQRHQSSRGSNEAEQVMQAKRRMAAQRERELRNLHTEQQYQRNTLPDVAPTGKHMTEEETRELIARQRSALYGEGPFADKNSYVDETGNIRAGAPGPNGPPSIRGASPLTFGGLVPPSGEASTPGSIVEPGPSDPSPRPSSTASPQTAGPTNKVFDNAVGPQSRTSTSSPTGGSPPRDLAPGSKPSQPGASVAPIGTRPSGPQSGTSSKRSTTPLATSSGGWGRGSGVWGQSSGLGTQASVWG